MCICVCMYACIYVYVCVYIERYFVYMCLCMYVCIHVYMCVYSIQHVQNSVMLAKLILTSVWGYVFPPDGEPTDFQAALHLHVRNAPSLLSCCSLSFWELILLFFPTLSLQKGPVDLRFARHLYAWNTRRLLGFYLLLFRSFYLRWFSGIFCSERTD